MQRLLVRATTAPIVALLILAMVATARPAQTMHSDAESNQDRGTQPDRDGGQRSGLPALEQHILDISNPFGVLNVAVRPTEEDTGALVYCRRKLGMRTGVVFATSYPRADCAGSQVEKLMQQSITAGRSEDADTYFMNLAYAGDSGSMDSVLTEWKHEVALEKLVRVIRDFKPDVIIATASTSSSDPESAALASLLLEAIPKAADTSAPSDSKSAPWSVARVFTRTEAGAARQIEIHLAEYDLANGSSYLAEANVARAAYGDRDVARAAYGGRDLPLAAIEGYALVYPTGGDKSVGPGNFVEGISLPTKLAAALTPPKVGDTPLLQAMGQGEYILGALIGVLALRHVEGGDKDPSAEFGNQYFRVVRFSESVRRAIATLLGLQFKVTLSRNTLFSGETATATLSLYNGNDKTFPIEFRLPSQISAAGDSSPDKSIITTVDRYGSLTQRADIWVPTNAQASLPSTVKDDLTVRYAADETLPGPRLPDPFGRQLTAEADVGLGPIILPLRATCRYDVAPQFSISAVPSIALIKDWSNIRRVNVTVRVVSHAPTPFTAELWVVQQALVKRDYEPIRLTFVRGTEELHVPLRLDIPILKPPLIANVLLELRRCAPAPPDALASAEIEVKPTGLDADEPRTVGCISGPSDDLGLALSELGYQCRSLSTRDIESGAIYVRDRELKTILIGPDAYSNHAELKFLNERLLDFVHKGGTLILFPQDPKSIVAQPGSAGPFPYPVKFSSVPIRARSLAIADSESELLSEPNKIVGDDISSLPAGCPVYLPKEWAVEYKCAIKVAGSQEAEGAGILLSCPYGEGSFVYAGFDSSNAFRSMTLVAYKLLANLLRSPAENKQKTSTYGPTD